MATPESGGRDWTVPVGKDLDHLRGFLHDSVGSLEWLHHTYGDIIAFKEVNQGTVFAFAPEYTRQVMVNLDAFYHTTGLPGPKNSAQRRFRLGLVGSNGESHQKHRRMLMPPFRKEAVEASQAMLVPFIDRFLSGWHVGQTIDLAAQMKELSLRLAGSLLFGIDDPDPIHAVEAAFEHWVDLDHEVSFHSALPFGDDNSELYSRTLEAASQLEEQLWNLVRLRQARTLDRPDMLGMVLKMRDAGGFSDAELIGQVHSLFNAAYHTTTSALTWVQFLLAQHPDVMRGLAGEIRSTLGESRPTVDKLARMSLLERVVKESLRMMPPVVYVPRIVMQPVQMGPYHVARGSTVVINQYVSHRLPEVFPNPARFWPDRWLRVSPSPFVYFPFGHGARLCLGAPLAQLMIKVTAVLTAQRFRLQVIPGARVDRHATLTLAARSIPTLICAADGRYQSSPVEGDVHDLIELPGRPMALAG